MMIQPIKTRVLTPPRDDLLSAIKEALPTLKERSILAVTSKVVSIGEGRAIRQDTVPDKDALVRKEADKYLARELTPHAWIMHTIKNNLLIPTAGIDESNGNGYYILWPKNPKQSARRIQQWLKKTYGVKECGVIITDSHSIPLRRGVVGISLAHHGFLPLRDYRGTLDLFGRPLLVTQLNIVDSLAAASVAVMGEGSERTPLALITGFDDIVFTPLEKKSLTGRAEKLPSSLEIDEKEDLYYPFLSRVPWQKSKG